MMFINSDSLDEVRIYNRALSAAEVLQLYNQGRYGEKKLEVRI